MSSRHPATTVNTPAAVETTPAEVQPRVQSTITNFYAPAVVENTPAVAEPGIRSAAASGNAAAAVENTAAVIEPDFQSIGPHQAPTAQTSINQPTALWLQTANALVPANQSEKLYFYCFAVQVLDYCTLKIIRGEYDSAYCQDQSLNYCVISCSRKCQAFMLHVCENFSEALNGVETLAVRQHFHLLQGWFPEIPHLTEGQLHACDARCRSSWGPALRHYLNANYKRYPEAWLQTFVLDDLDNIPAPANLYINVGTGIPHFITKTGKKEDRLRGTAV